MTFDYIALQETLTKWPEGAFLELTAATELLDRIRQILQSTIVDGVLSGKISDLIPLIRQLLYRQAAQDKRVAQLRVLRTQGWPTEAEWSQHSIQAAPVGLEHFIVQTQPWMPSWLDETVDVFADAMAKVPVREPAPCPIDPFVQDATNFGAYVSSGQREAVRAAFFMPTGSTLIVNLPTGSGKSLVGHAPVLTDREDGRLTLFVVPTIALALDQARQMRSMLQSNRITADLDSLAFHSGLTKEQRQAIRKNIIGGTQRILFLAPEALCGSLLRAVYAAAEQGFLKYLVIDEAHLTVQWGDEFRPAFQALSGLRRGLLRQCPHERFRTILMSATLTQETIETLSSLFGPIDSIQLISAVHLRPEPQYWIHKSNSALDKRQKVLEALRHAPRPFLLYVTTREDARAWFNILRNGSRYSRIDCFHGDTDAKSRMRIIDEWNRNRLDGIVATSAFGVGMDKGDVRTIIHATVPENLDRFYQEVGRGGRDGNVCSSLLVYDEEEDIGTAKSLSEPTLIGDDLGYSRWKTLYGSRTRNTSDLVSVDTSVVPPHLRGSSDENRAWNMRTLLLMARANMLEMDSEPFPTLERDHEEDDESFDSRYEAISTEYFNRASIRILVGAHMDPVTWQNQITQARERGLSAARRNFELMKNVLNMKMEVSEALRYLYEIGPPWNVRVEKVCGGCPLDRRDEHAYRRHAIPIAVPIQRIESRPPTKWHETFPWLDPSFVVITYDSSDKHSMSHASEAFQLLIAEFSVGEITFFPNNDFAQKEWFRNLYKWAAGRTLIYRNLSTDAFGEPYMPLPRITLLDGRSDSGTIPDFLMLVSRPLHVVLAPHTLRDSSNAARRYCDVHPNCITLEDFIKHLKQ